MFNPDSIKGYNTAKAILAPIFKLIVHVKSSGKENIPEKGPFLLIGNHRSDMDPWVIGLACPRYIAWIADFYLFDLPGIGFLLEESGSIPMSAKPRDQITAFRRSKEILEAGQVVGIFPEGHSTITGYLQHLDLGEFYGGFAEYAIRFKVPILPVTILPRKEKYEPLNFPKFIRRLMGMPEEVIETEKRLVYDKVHINFGKLIEVEPYLKKIKDSKTPRETTKQAMKELVEKAYTDIKEVVTEHRKRGTWEQALWTPHQNDKKDQKAD